MDSRVRASPEQLSILLEYMETHGDLARPLAGAQGRIRSDRRWSDLTNILNAVGGGVTKTTDKWKKVWADWKSKTKKKGLAIRQHSRGTGGGPASRQTLSALEERLLTLMGALPVEGQASVEELGFNRSQSPARDDPLTVDDAVYLEITDGPGSTKPAAIPRSQLKYLLFVVQGLGQTRKKYTYWTARNIAQDPRINFNKKTLLLALGYLDSPNFLISSMLANEYEARGYNIILVDYNRFATVHYHLASRLMRPVGKHVAEVLTQLTESGLDPSKLELLGFSLGGQTVSYIAKNFQRFTGRNISKITALEPSGPCFRTLGPDDRLDASNADFVEVVHTNIDGYGMAARMGHVDFFVNGGEYQPSELSLYPCTITCSHFRVLPLWVSAMKNPNDFIAIKCDSIQQARDAKCYDRRPVETNVLGIAVNRSNHGIFYLSTSKGYPYYLGTKGLSAGYASWKQISKINENDDVEIYT